MTEHFRKPPIYEPDDASWPALLRFANEVAMAYRRKNQQLRKQLAERDEARDKEIADLHQQIELHRRIIRTEVWS